MFVSLDDEDRTLKVMRGCRMGLALRIGRFWVAQVLRWKLLIGGSVGITNRWKTTTLCHGVRDDQQVMKRGTQHSKGMKGGWGQRHGQTLAEGGVQDGQGQHGESGLTFGSFGSSCLCSSLSFPLFPPSSPLCYVIRFIGGKSGASFETMVPECLIYKPFDCSGSY